MIKLFRANAQDTHGANKVKQVSPHTQTFLYKKTRKVLIGCVLRKSSLHVILYVSFALLGSPEMRILLWSESHRLFVLQNFQG